MEQNQLRMEHLVENQILVQAKRIVENSSNALAKVMSDTALAK